MSEPPADISGISMTPSGLPAKPRRAKPHSPVWGYIALGGWFAIAGLIGAFIGTVLAQLL